jgi:DNA-binding transcriptional regulator YhcF (GntR family)
VIVTVDPGGPQPPYQQIRVQVLEAVSSGSLPAGVRLPTIRQLAVDLDLAANTVARAYRELEADGVIETRGRRGSFVCEHSVAEVGSATTRQLDAIARACITEARRLGAPTGDIAQAIARALTAPSSS